MLLDVPVTTENQVSITITSKRHIQTISHHRSDASEAEGCCLILTNVGSLRGFVSLFTGGCWPMVSFSCTILIWLWYWGSTDSVTWVLRCCIFFHVGKSSGDVTDGFLKSRLGLLDATYPNWVMKQQKLDQNRRADNEIGSAHTVLPAGKLQNQMSLLPTQWVFWCCVLNHHKLCRVLK